MIRLLSILHLGAARPETIGAGYRGDGIPLKSLLGKVAKSVGVK